VLYLLAFLDLFSIERAGAGKWEDRKQGTGALSAVFFLASTRTAAVANQSAADTRLTITIGSQCFTHVVTKKID